MFSPHHFANPAEHGVDDLLADGVVAAGVVVGGVFLATDELLRVEEPVVGPGPDLICARRRRRNQGEQNTEKGSGRSVARAKSMECPPGVAREALRE